MSVKAQITVSTVPASISATSRSMVSVGGAVIALLGSVPRISFVEDLVGGPGVVPLRDVPHEVVPAAGEPEGGGEQQHGEDGDGRVVERVTGARRVLRQHEEDHDEHHPDDGDPAERRAPPAEMPGAGAELRVQASQQDGY